MKKHKLKLNERFRRNTLASYSVYGDMLARIRALNNSVDKQISRPVSRWKRWKMWFMNTERKTRVKKC